MAEAPEVEGGRANVPAISVEASYASFKLSLKIYDRWLAVPLGVGIAAYCIRHPQLVKDTLKKALEFTAGLLVNSVQPGSLLVELHCHTKKSFLLFMDDFETKNLERRLNIEFRKTGYNEELEVTITNVKEAYMHLEQLRGVRSIERMASSDKIKVVLLASEWSSKRGGLSTLNRELAIKLAEHSDVQVSVFLPKCDDNEEKEARDKKITLVQAERIAGSKDEIQWLCHPPTELKIDFIIGHGVVLGYPAQMIRKYRPCKWVQFVHTDPEELGMCKDYSDAVSKGEAKHQSEVELCTMADFVVAVGPKLADAYCSYLRFCGKDQNVFNLTPGIFSEFANVLQSKQEGDIFRVLSFGRSDAEDFYLKGFDIAAKAVGKVNNALLIFVGAEPKKQDEAAARLKECNLPATRLRVRAYIESRDHLKKLFSEVDLAIMPSRTEGFGLAALEALSAGLPVLVSGNSGFGEALDKEVSFGSTCVIQSEEVDAWAEAIDKVKKKPRGTRLDESKCLLDNYAKRYNWAKQITDLVEKMKDLRNGFSAPSSPSTAEKEKGENMQSEESVLKGRRQSGTARAAKQSEANTQSASIKDGIAEEDDLEELSLKLGDSWEALARRLGFNEAEITAFHKENEEYAKKALKMLFGWRKRDGPKATYSVLYTALCHKFVKRADLAETFCVF